MKLALILNVVLLFVTCGNAQTIEVEYNKKKDMSAYKTFQFGETEVITPKDKQVMEEGKIREIANKAIELELAEKGLQRVDSNAHLVLSYVIGSMERSSVFNSGRLDQAQSPVVQDYDEASFIIDLNDRSNNLIWRINAVTNFTATNAESLIDQVLEKGFKKFPNKPKKKK